MIAINCRHSACVYVELVICIYVCVDEEDPFQLGHNNLHKACGHISRWTPRWHTEVPHCDTNKVLRGYVEGVLALVQFK